MPRLVTFGAVPGIDLALVDDVASVDCVLEDRVELPSGESHTAEWIARQALSAGRADAFRLELLGKQPNAPKRQVSLGRCAG